MDSGHESLHRKASPRLHKFAKALRQHLTDAEILLWQYLRNRQAAGLKFRRQHPIDRFVADFYCHEKKLIVELDGGIHANPDQAIYDTARTEMLNELGIAVLRLSNEEVLKDASAAVARIIAVAAGR